MWILFWVSIGGLLLALLFGGTSMIAKKDSEKKMLKKGFFILALPSLVLFIVSVVMILTWQ